MCGSSTYQGLVDHAAIQKLTMSVITNGSLSVGRIWT